MQYETTFKTEFNRLMLAFQKGTDSVAASTVYWDRLKGQRDDVFHEAVNRLLDSARFFPTIAEVHGMCDRVSDEWEKETKLAREAEVREQFRLGAGVEYYLPICATCSDKLFLRYDVPVGHRDFGKTYPCPDCGGPSRDEPVDELSVAHYDAERNRARYPQTNDVPVMTETTNEPPPNGFASPRLDLIPHTDAEEAAGRARVQVAREVAALRKKMQMPGGAQ